MSKISLLVAALLLPVAALAAVLQDPPAIAVPNGLTAETVQKVVSIAAAQRQWVVSETAPGQLEASLLVRNKHMLKVAIGYDASSVRISYLDSAQMDYSVKDGVAQIHSKYMNWTRNLALDITNALALAQVTAN